MNFATLNKLIWLGSYTAVGCWALLLFVLLLFIFKRNWLLVKRALKCAINSVVFFIAWAFILDMALIVKPAIYQTKEASVAALKLWIKSHQLNDIYFSVATLLVLFVVNLLFHFKGEQRKFKKDLFLMPAAAALVLMAGIWLTGQHAYISMMQEIELHFK